MKFSEIFIFVNIECAAILRLWRDINDYFKRKEEIFWCMIFTLFKCLSKFDLDIIKKHFNSMGPIVSFLQNNDKANEMQKAAKQALDISQKLVNTRFDAFESQLNIGIGAIKKVPGQYLIASKKIISCNVSKGTQQNRNAISGIVSEFAKGGIADGIVKTLFSALDMILGSFSASYDESQDYMLLTNLIGGVYRIDYLVINQKLTATGITSNVQSVFGSYLVISSVQKEQLKSDNVYKILVDRQFPDKTLYIKFILIKLLREETLSPEEMNIVGNLTYDPLKFNQKGELVDKDGNPVYPPLLKQEVPQPPPVVKMLQMPIPHIIERAPIKKLMELTKRDRLKYEIDYNQAVAAQLKQKFLQHQFSRAQAQDALKDLENDIAKTKNDLQEAIDNANRFKIQLKDQQAQERELESFIKMVKNLKEKGLKLEEVRKEFDKAVESQEDHGEEELPHG